MYARWGLILGKVIAQWFRFDLFSEGRGIATFTGGFYCLSMLTQFRFHGFLVCDNSGKHNALLEYGVFEPICYSEFPPSSWLSQKSLSFVRWSASSFIFSLAVGCFPLLWNTHKAQINRLWLQCFSHCWCVYYPARFMSLFCCLSKGIFFISVFSEYPAMRDFS